ncbi:MAG: endonuclease [Candidatus Nealsonbacteria bacterium]|nr:endonuclease [Candidatus Nealsonbacteria bacterium]
MNAFEKLYQELRRKYGKPEGQWGMWCKRPKTRSEKEEVVVGAILTQRTNWKNVGLAMANLKKAKIKSIKDICRSGASKLALKIKPSGFYQTKAGYLFGLAKFVIKRGGLDGLRGTDPDKLREELLELKGVGPETADSILLYALDKPVFVIDEYTRRLVKKRKLARNLSYSFLQKRFEENLRKDFRLFQDFHALVVIDGKNK